MLGCTAAGMHGSTVGFTLSSDFAWKKVESCNLLEEGLGETFDQQELTLSMRPFEIKTFKI